MWMLMALASGAAATRLFVTSYAGTLTTLDLSKSPTGYDVHSVASTNSCSPSPSWLTLDKPNKLLYCIDENTSQGYPDGHGSVNSYLINDNGTLSQTARVSTSAGPVSGVLYGDETPALALAHYDGGAVSANKRSSTGIGDPITEIFLDDPTTTHAHEVILDPTSQFIVVPDLGASKIRTFSIDRKTSNLTERNSYDLPAGTGPRHGAFYVPTGGSGKTYFYLAAELSNTLRGFQVTYTHDDQLDFQQLFVTNTYGGGDVPAGAAAAELQISPDNRFVVVSNRNATGMASDPIATWEIQDDASLSFVQLQGTGGPFPRQFSINAAGDILAAGLSDGRVVFIARDVESGKLGETLATQEIAGTITCVRWDE